METPVEVNELSDLFGTPEDRVTGFSFGGKSGDMLLNKGAVTGHYLGGKLLDLLLDSAAKPIARLGGPLQNEFRTLDGQPTNYVVGGMLGTDIYYVPSTR